MMRAAAPPVYLASIVSVPAFVALFPWLVIKPLWGKALWAFVAAPTYAVAFVLIAGLLSLPHQAAIKPGRYSRSLADPDYRGRRLYGLCWTVLYYCTPVYFVVLSVPLLKRLAFRLFGYRGSLDFTIYPDTWIRDLPLLDIGAGAYISNRATLGTNMVLTDGSVIVDRVTIGAGSLVGHLAMLGPGTVIGTDSEIGVATVLAVRVNIGNRVVVGAVSRIDSGVSVADGAHVGRSVYLGCGTRVLEAATVATGRSVAARTVISAGGGGGKSRHRRNFFGTRRQRRRTRSACGAPRSRSLSA
jgi:carbonic anhydrase/acetyltransferase-like protein (isoleucine patch superfamily)